MSKPLEDPYQEKLYVYNGPGKPAMTPLPPTTIDANFLHRQEVCLERAKEIDFLFMKSILMDKECPEYNGFCS